METMETWEDIATPEEMYQAAKWIYTFLIDSGMCPYQSEMYHTVYDAMFECRQIAEELEASRTMEVVSRLQLSGTLEAMGFLVDGEIPDCCPGCGQPLQEIERDGLDGASIEIYQGCPGICGLFWYVGSYSIF